MSAEDKKQRYEHILNNINKCRPFGRAKPEEKPRAPHDRALDLINAFDALAELPQAEFKNILCYGTQSSSRTMPGQAWSSGITAWAITAIRLCIYWAYGRIIATAS